METTDQKTGLLVIATILTATGTTILATNLWAGVALLGIAVVLIILRGYLEKIGIAASNRK